MPQSSTKEHPTAENSDVLNRNFDLSVTDHIQQLENPQLYSYMYMYVASVAAVT